MIESKPTSAKEQVAILADLYGRYMVESSARVRLASLSTKDRDRALAQIKERVIPAAASDYVFRGEIVAATAAKGRHDFGPGRA